MSNSSRSVRNAVRLALMTAATSAAPLALAQTTPAQPAPAVEEVVVTGSRLLQAPNDISISPISSVTQDDIVKTGLVRVEDILGNLPQMGAEQNSGTSISSVGVATVSLRSLGSQRTLVLVNGKRLNPGGAGGVPGGNANSADINQIPAALIERVDVLTGGASAVYGADAVAGVVNFVLNTHYEGVKIDGNYSFNNHSNDNSTYLGYLNAFGAPTPSASTLNSGYNKDFSIVAGSNFADGKGNATVYATYLTSSPVAGFQVDHAGCTLIGGSTPSSAIRCGGSGTSAHGQFIVLGQTGTTAKGAPLITSVVDNAVDPTTGAFRAFNGSDLYNYGALSYFQRQAERWTAGGFLHYDVNEHASIYSETMYARNSSQAQYGPSGSFFQTVQVSCQDPFLTAQEQSVLCNATTLAQNHLVYPTNPPNYLTMLIARRSVESGGRQDNYTSNSIRQVLGAKGSINDVWTYDGYAQVGITTFGDIEGNFLGIPQITNALNAVPGPGGTAVCASGPPCVPWNVWVPGGSSGAVTAAQLAYLGTPATYAVNATEYVGDGSVTGDLGKYGVKLPTATHGLTVNFGTEWRQETFKFDPDFVFLNGFQAGGAPSKAINGQFRVWEGFTEMRLPLIEDRPGAFLLSLDAGYRYSSYTLGFNTNTYKFGVEWAPLQDVRLRGGYNRAVRAPNADELFEPAAVGAGGTADPCWGPLANPALGTASPLTNGNTFAFCSPTGVTAAQYGHIAVNPAAQINTQVGGNAALVPETADTYTFGLVFQPQAIPGLVASIDAFNIKIKETITSLNSNTIVSNCGLTGSASLCGLIHRGPTGSLWLDTSNFVQATFLNIGTNSTRGADLAANYRLAVGSAGRLSFSLAGTYVHDFLLQPLPTRAAFDCKGFWGATCGAPLPSWRHVFNVGWATPWKGLELDARWRYLGSSSVDRSSSDPQLTAKFYLATAHIPAYNYVDLSASIPIGTTADVRLGVNNVADKNPPLILNGTLSDCPNTTCNDNTWVGTYDTLGRYIYVHAGVKF
jgi:iron complex outermembrane recepter protein